jgi:hypothetical protein
MNNPSSPDPREMRFDEKTGLRLQANGSSSQTAKTSTNDVRMDPATGRMVNPDQDRNKQAGHYDMSEYANAPQSYCCGLINTGQSFCKNCCRVTVCCVCIPAAVLLIVFASDKAKDINIGGVADKLNCFEKIDCDCLTKCCDTDKCRQVCDCAKCLKFECCGSVCNFICKDCLGNIGNCLKCNVFCCQPDAGCYNVCQVCHKVPGCGSCNATSISCCVNGFCGFCQKSQATPLAQNAAICCFCCFMHSSITNQEEEERKTREAQQRNNNSNTSKYPIPQNQPQGNRVHPAPAQNNSRPPYQQPGPGAVIEPVYPQMAGPAYPQNPMFAPVPNYNSQPLYNGQPMMGPGMGSVGQSGYMNNPQMAGSGLNMNLGMNAGANQGQAGFSMGFNAGFTAQGRGGY